MQKIFVEQIINANIILCTSKSLAKIWWKKWQWQQQHCSFHCQKSLALTGRQTPVVLLHSTTSKDNFFIFWKTTTTKKISSESAKKFFCWLLMNNFNGWVAGWRILANYQQNLVINFPTFATVFTVPRVLHVLSIWIRLMWFGCYLWVGKTFRIKKWKKKNWKPNSYQFNLEWIIVCWQNFFNGL